MWIYVDLCEGRWIYARGPGFMRIYAWADGFMWGALGLVQIYTDLCEGRWIYARGDGFIWIYMDLNNGRWVYTELCQGRRIYARDAGFMRI